MEALQLPINRGMLRHILSHKSKNNLEFLMKHILSRQDTPEKLSARYGIPVCMLYRANAGKTWKAGQAMWIPPLCWCACREYHAWQMKKENIFYCQTYRVQKGDQLFSIAQRFHTSMNKIMEENNLKHPQDIKEDMQLQIPCLNENFMIYSYRMADTPEQVAEKFAMSQEELITLNQAQSGIYPGMELIVRKRGVK